MQGRCVIHIIFWGVGWEAEAQHALFDACPRLKDMGDYLQTVTCHDMQILAAGSCGMTFGGDHMSLVDIYRIVPNRHRRRIHTHATLALTLCLLPSRLILQTHIDAES